jgi:hypothetical protein
MGWSVVSQRGTEILVSGGRWQQVMEVTVETSSGTTHTFPIPMANYTVEYVKAVVDEWYQRESAIGSL